MHLFNVFGGNSDPVQLMYGSKAYSKYFELAMYGLMGKELAMAARPYIDCTNLN